MIESVTPRREQRAHAIGIDGIDGIGQPDVRDAGVGEDFGLGQLRAADADRAGLDLPARDDRTLVRLGVRPQRARPPTRQRLHGRDIGVHPRAIDGDERGRESQITRRRRDQVT